MTADAIQKIVGVLLYLAVLLVIGVVAMRRTRDLRDYVVAGKRLRFFSVAFSARATGESAWLLLGLTGMGAAVGLKAFWVVAGELLGVGAAWLLMARPFWRYAEETDAITVPDWLEERLDDRSHVIRRIAAFALVVFVTIYVSAQIDATGQAFEKFVGWNYFVGATLGFLVVLAYTVGGGFVAVVWSDVFQGTMMVVGLVVLPVVGLMSIGGVGALGQELAAQDPTLLSWSGGDLSATGVASILALLFIGLGFLGSPQIFARFLALRSEREIAPGTAVALTWTLFADAGAVTIGLLARALLGVDGEDALPNLVEHLMPTFAVGLYIAIVLAATMSTVDSLLIVASSAAVRDWYQKVRHPDLGEEGLLRKIRLATVVLALAALAIALGVAAVTETRTVFWFVVFGWSGIAATFCPTMLLALFWSGLTRSGAAAAMIAGFVSVPVFKFFAPALPTVGPFFGALEELLPSFVVSLLVGVAVSAGRRERRPEAG